MRVKYARYVLILTFCLCLVFTLVPALVTPAAATDLLVSGRSDVQSSPGTTVGSPAANQFDQWTARGDLSVVLKSKPLIGRFRWRDKVSRYCGELKPTSQIRLLAGPLYFHWGNGVVLVDERKQRLRLTPARSTPFRHLNVRVSTSATENVNRGFCLLLPVSSCKLVIGCGERERLLALTHSRFGFALAGRRDMGKWLLAWSAVYTLSSPDHGSGASWVCVEIGAPFSRRQTSGSDEPASPFNQSLAPSLGCQWQTCTSPVLGRLRGQLRAMPATQPRSEGPLPDNRAESGWLFAWELPLMRSGGAELQLSNHRANSTQQNLPEIDRSLGLILTSEPWSGCEVRSTLSTSKRYICRDNPGDPDHKVLILSKQSLIDFKLTCQISSGLDISLRYRHVGGDLVLSADEIPRLATIVQETDPVEPAEASVMQEFWWGREMGGISTIRLRWRKGPFFRGGLTLAATPEAGGGASAVPIRIPPGRSYWRLLGGGSRFVELWLGGGNRQWRLEGALRFHTDRLGQGDQASFLLGVSLPIRLSKS